MIKFFKYNCGIFLSFVIIKLESLKNTLKDIVFEKESKQQNDNKEVENEVENEIEQDIEDALSMRRWKTIPMKAVAIAMTIMMTFLMKTLMLKKIKKIMVVIRFVILLSLF
jgi:hypothetical protein